MANTPSGSEPHETFDRTRADLLTYWGVVHQVAMTFFEALSDVDLTATDDQQSMVWDAFGLLHSMAHEHYRDLGVEETLDCRVEVISPAVVRQLLKQAVRRFE